MPELPEVETTRNGIAPHVIGQNISAVTVRNHKLRKPIPPMLKTSLPGHAIRSVDRRGKYLLCRFDHGCMLIHLGMSGSLRIVDAAETPRKHDHFELFFASGTALRFHDPRRFGVIVWTRRDPLKHKLLKALGPEPLSDDFTGEWLYRRSRNRTQAVKNFIMDSHNVVGIGNIYANEALFKAAIKPVARAGAISMRRYQRLADAIKEILQHAIELGGTTLRDFVNGQGRPGYFRQQLKVYQCAGQACPVCSKTIKSIRIGQRSAFYCGVCQR